ncbi:NAD(P)/FAD-dependent oxidoreductase [Vreelandella alkaliphila]|uniref:NAD(P)/FAD-dependent oxidoreductase n=1 Tax=Vreelandella alkaliphila TaxID=272774 RepID=UPI000EA17DA8|nr:FAD-dependent oxidoreductase [Halomonas alkaliphila]AYF32622.1 NAD(P)/FAD-dependent oxidoreductase [Halomonas alkaliphila]
METASRCASIDHLIIIGNGMASHRLIEALVRHPRRPTCITVIGEEPVPAYNRILLSPLLAGELATDALTFRDQAWYAEQGITLLLDEKVVTIDRDNCRITTESDRCLDYDHLVIATGSRPTIPNVSGIELAGVHSFRDLQDATALEAIAQRGGNAVVIGGGLLGLEAAEGLRKRGSDIKVSVLQRSERLMNRQLDETAACLLENTLSQRGIHIATNASLAVLEDNGHGHVQAVMLSDGRRLPADSVIVAAGITPNVELGQQAGLRCERAIVVDAHLTTSDPHIAALGECCQFDQRTYGLVEPIWRQVDVLAAVLCGETTDGYQEVTTATKLKVSGVALFAFGPTEAGHEHDVLRYRDPESGDYRRLLLRDGQLEGAVLYGDTRHGPWYFEQALASADLTACRQTLLFGPSDAEVLQTEHADNANSPASSSSASPSSSHLPTSEVA